ncbi:BCS1 N terminal-domain-containing protein [Phyllosticta paracitricarpa]|uniref:BCS1 N terminal-domain-containing protein n=1 Tax=Phyllosticta paracitricarpa TaxID=2016321 RepID=A0ABR1NLK6_9PEZI
MDFKKVFKALDSPEGDVNGTQISLAELPSNLLEAFIPGYSLISRFVLLNFGFDVGIIVSLGVLTWALFTSVQYLFYLGYGIFANHYMSSVYIDDEDDLFHKILAWVAKQRMSKRSRSIKAVSRNSTSGTEYERDQDSALDEHGIFNFSKWSANIPPRYEPYYGVHHFWHEGRLFVFDRSRREVQQTTGYLAAKDEELVKLSCIGRSTGPIRNLLAHIKTWSLETETALTSIRRPSNHERARLAGIWDRLRSKPSRPIETVALDYEQKRRIIADINEYLHPASPRWYARRGIPHRRGYLFYGAPGVGKTSLAYALAGVFGLEIFCISLLDPSLTESTLNRLFANLPHRCIVLLEDIDSAGLTRDDQSDAAASSDTPASSTKKEKCGGELSAETIANAIKSATAASNRKGPKHADGAGDQGGISLSGLLNAIDGVAAHEGRVLIMTTNHPEKLDDALIRPGRVDLQVEFTLATKDQIHDIFVRMYAPDGDEPAATDGSATITSSRNTANGKPSSAPSPSHPNTYSTPWAPALSATELKSMASTFAAKLPEDKLSPAEVQNFLLARKKDPTKALDDVDVWCAALLEAKEKKSKVLKVQ